MGRFALRQRLDACEGGERWLAQAIAPPAEWALVEQLATADRVAAARLLEDARLLARQRHPHLASIVGVSAGTEPAWIAFAARPSDDLETIARTLRARGQRLPLPHALHLGLALATALHHLHESRADDGRPLVHGQLSPARVRIGHDGAVELLWGPAPAAGERLIYFSPEQRRGEPIDRRGDLFALGALLYELTVGRRLHTEAALASPRMLVPGYDARLEAILLRLLERDRERRPATARALQAALEELAHGGPTASSSSSLATWVRTVVGGSFEGAEITRVERNRAALATPTRADASGRVEGAASARADVTPSWRLLAPARAGSWLRGRARVLLPAIALAFVAGAGVGLLRRRASPPTTIVPPSASTPPPQPVVELPAPIVALPPPRAPAPTTGTMQIVTSPGGATLRLDGRRLPEHSPARLTGLDAGAVHVLAVELGARGVTERFVLAPAEEASLEIDLHHRRRHKVAIKRSTRKP